MYDEDIKTEDKSTSSIGGLEHSHESFGMVSVSRVSSSHPQKLFGSEVGTNNLMKLTVSKASVNQNLGRNWYHSKDDIVEVYLTPVQYAEMISSPNTQGVPCTINYSIEHGPIKSKNIDTVTQHVESVIDEKLSNFKEEAAKSLKEINQLLNKKGTINKSERESIFNLANKLTAELTSSIPFYEKSVKESIEKAKLEAKVEIDSHITHAITNAGINSINNDPSQLSVEMYIPDDVEHLFR